MKFESTVDDQIVANQDSSVALSRCGCGSTAFGSLPCHDLEVKDINIVIILFAVPATENVHLCASDYVGGVIEPGRWSAGTARTLVPSHRYWVESVKVFECLAALPFASLTAEDYDPGASK